MREYVCVDGPLQGHLYSSPHEPRVGEVVTIRLIGIDGSTPNGAPQPEARYVVNEPPQATKLGQLGYVLAQGLYRKPALPASLRESADH